MIFRRRTVFLQEYIGLANRLESLTLAFAIRRAHGHDLWLDWPELDALSVRDTATGAPGFFGRFRALRLREDVSAEQFAQLGAHPRILQRTFRGPDAPLQAEFAATLDRIQVRPPIAAEVHRAFRAHRQRPVVGMHLRRGDYAAPDDRVYDVNAARHPAVPLWWYEQTMAALVARFGPVAFLVSYSGEGAELAPLRRNFDLFEVPTPNPYRRALAAHGSLRHPVVDLFALACCTVILATPLSSFSHYAANLLGPPSACLLPPVRVTRHAWAAARFDAPGCRLVPWTAACRSGQGQAILPAQFPGIEPAPPRLDWLPVVPPPSADRTAA